MKIRMTIFLVIIVLSAVAALTKCAPTQKLPDSEFVLPEGVPVPAGYVLDDKYHPRSEPSITRSFDYAFVAQTGTDPDQMRKDYEALLKNAGWEQVSSNVIEKREKYESAWRRDYVNAKGEVKKDRLKVSLTAKPNEDGYKMQLHFAMN